jgi:hypothetical protein
MQHPASAAAAATPAVSGLPAADAYGKTDSGNPNVLLISALPMASRMKLFDLSV